MSVSEGMVCWLHRDPPPSDDCCPWEGAGPGAGAGAGATSALGAAHLDSGGSSSDVSVAIAEVSDRLRKSVCLPTPQSSIGGPDGARRLSVQGGRPSVSSSEDLANTPR